MINKDTTTYINTGEFFDKHPDVIGNVSRFERTDEFGNLIESWERNAAGIMVDVTERDIAIAEVEKAKKELAKMEDKLDG